MSTVNRETLSIAEAFLKEIREKGFPAKFISDSERHALAALVSISTKEQEQEQKQEPM